MPPDLPSLDNGFAELEVGIKTFGIMKATIRSINELSQVLQNFIFQIRIVFNISDDSEILRIIDRIQNQI